MSSRSRIVAPAYPDPLTSGTYVVTGAFRSSSPRPASTPAAQPRIDLDTDMSRCRVPAVMPVSYRSATSWPSCRTTQASVNVSSSTSVTVAVLPSTRSTAGLPSGGPSGSGAGDPAGIVARNELAHMLETPAVERGILPVSQRDLG